MQLRGLLNFLLCWVVEYHTARYLRWPWGFKTFETVVSTYFYLMLLLRDVPTYCTRSAHLLAIQNLREYRIRIFLAYILNIRRSLIRMRSDTTILNDLVLSSIAGVAQADALPIIGTNSGCGDFIWAKCHIQLLVQVLWGTSWTILSCFTAINYAISLTSYAAIILKSKVDSIFAIFTKWFLVLISSITKIDNCCLFILQC